MEYRKLIKFGNSSHVVSIPNEWIKRNNLKKGDTLYLSENGSNELILSPKVDTTNLNGGVKEIIIDISNCTTNDIKTKLTSAYLNDHTEIKITGSNLKQNISFVRECIQNLVALEIVEQTGDSIITRDFLNMNEVSVKDLIRKMDIITRSMISELPLILKENASEFMRQREMDVNKLFYVVLRVVRAGLKNPQYANTIKCSSTYLFIAWNIANHIEKIADHIAELANYATKGKFTEGEIRFINSTFTDINKFYSDVMKAYYNSDLELAYKVTSYKRGFISNLTGNIIISKKSKNPIFSYMLDRLIIITNEINNVARRVYS